MSSNNQQHTATPLFLVPPFRGGNIQVKSLSVLIAHCLETFWEEGLRENLQNTRLKTYYTPQLCSIVQDQPPYHGSFLRNDPPRPRPRPRSRLRPPEKLVMKFFNDFHFASSTSLSWSLNFTSSFNYLMRSNNHPVFVAYAG